MKIVELLPSKIYELKLLPVKYLKCSFNSFDGSCSLHFIHTILYGRFYPCSQWGVGCAAELQTMKVWSIKEWRIRLHRLDETRKTRSMWMWIISLVIFHPFFFYILNITHYTYYRHDDDVMCGKRMELRDFFLTIFRVRISPPPKACKEESCKIYYENFTKSLPRNEKNMRKKERNMKFMQKLPPTEDF